MQIARFDKFVQEIRGNETLRSFANSFKVYRYYENQWFGEKGEKIEDEIICKKLKKTLEQKIHWRERNCCESYFPIEELYCAIEGFFVSPTKKTTRDRFQRIIEEELKHAMNAFDAEHDVLTGLLNRSAFDEVIRNILSDMELGSSEEEGDVESFASGNTVALLALDIDNFKQVNDTYGHIYGDIVLSCLAMRMEKIGRNIESGKDKTVKIYIGRPSGEEFLLLLTGRLNIAECLEIAEEYRMKIGESKLPSEDELNYFPDKDKLASINLPKVQERIITVSIGMAYLVGVSEGETDKCRSSLEDQADTALYYAKAGGRNTVRYFSDIVNKYGSVLEHHSETSVVVIDIGRRLKVKVGQEFLVYHLDFTGNKAFVYRDGRTEKRLGTYPRLPTGRIVVFDVQDDISFCNLAEYKGTETIPVGSHLEAVPLGSISHLIKREYGMSFFEEPNLVSAEKLSHIVNEAANKNLQFFVAVFVLNDSDLVINERGTAFANEALAKLFRTIKDEFNTNTIISQIRTTQFAVYLEDIDDPKIVNVLYKTLTTASQRCDRLASFSAGYFCERLMKKKKIKGDNSQLDSKYALQYAMYGASNAAMKAGSIVMFTPRIASQIILKSRKKGLYIQAAEDYKKLNELGVKTASLENQIGLCSFEMSPPNYKHAIDTFEKAIEINPKGELFRLNLGLALYESGNQDGAIASFIKVLEINPEYNTPIGYFGAMGVCLFNSYKDNPQSVDTAWLYTLLVKARDNFEKSVVKVSIDEIEEGIETLAKVI